MQGGSPGILLWLSESLAAGDAVRAVGFKATLQAIESVMKKTATCHSMRVLAARMGETQGPPDKFFVKEEERALSKASYGSMPDLCLSPRKESGKVVLVRGKQNKGADSGYNRSQGMEFVSIWPSDFLGVFLLCPSPNYIVFGVYCLARSPGKCFRRGASGIKEWTAGTTSRKG
ncbi:hypothetical protein B0H13DRAFT_1894752 [Mycena leptocephala]|nr:hypothetical protein B0H13DRAFT_1894752 [Mycena leptocephala]